MKQTNKGGGIAAYLIDPSTQTIEPVTLTRKPTPLAELYQLLGCKLVTAVPIDEHDSIYVDDEGLINGPVRQFFGIRGNGQPLAGRGLVLGIDDDGNDASARITLSELRRRIVFIERLLPDFYHVEGAEAPVGVGFGMTLAEVQAYVEREVHA